MDDCRYLHFRKLPLVVLVALHLACAEVESEELYKELLQGIDISAFFTTHITPVITLAPLLCIYTYIYIHNFQML